MKPIVSIITPYRNADRFLPRFVACMRAQTRQDWICLMVDDGSEDNGPYNLRALVADDPRFILITNTLPKSWPGPASARNCALAAVSTDLVAFCDVDDLWHPEKLEQQLSFHLTHKLDLSVSAYARFYDNQPDEPIKSIVCPPAELSFGTLRGRNPIPMLTVILSADLAGVGFEQVAHEDFLFWLRLFSANPTLRYGCLPSVLAFYCIHDRNLSSSKLFMPGWAYQVFRQYGKSRIGSFFMLLAWATSHLYSQSISRLTRSDTHVSTAQLLANPPKNLR